MPGLIDSHCHLQHEAFDADREAVIERAREAGIQRILVPGYDLPSSEAAIVLARQHPGLIDAAIGVHPHYAGATGADGWRQLESLAPERSVVALGEIGLDFFRNLSSRAVQLEAFERQLDLAARVAKPIIVHDRDAHAEILAMLGGWGRGHEPNGILHCFSGDAAMAGQLAGVGFLVSFALPLRFSSAVGPRAAAVALGDEQFLVETDAPWLAPGGGAARNEPTTALRVASELGRLRGSTPQAISDSVARAYARLVGGQVA